MIQIIICNHSKGNKVLSWVRTLAQLSLHYWLSLVFENQVLEVVTASVSNLELRFAASVR